MTTPTISIRKAETAELDRIEALLEASGLPSEDVREKPSCFFVGHDDAELVGIGGVEPHGSNGLLRSVVVAEPHRGQGYGTALCDALEGRARANEIETLYLLTTTAATFFRGRGYEVTDRETVPESIRGTTEFADLCPDSATCMRKDLDE
ncbi:arsenic resistance N-acetyltransferase ArsN2 [Halorussus sp. MSC15.2]|uniref:arsenic resistance N-acetyltransferase ArsN2 n=1 Tax=Halorussus sp. MSC15.2 TaxID=2283638 RepID=UPI0013D76BA5|nr:arsenic resistance N-acetyltransferase ArsN2 [Halorussus sp. MSC15.2]NEU57040.1 GNAT family N-acetyltransferase [Halorussus sp. MSC15.2]